QILGSFRGRRRETINDAGDLIHDDKNTSCMQSIQVLIEKARHAPEDVQKGIIRAGLVRYLYRFEPRQKPVDPTTPPDSSEAVARHTQTPRPAAGIVAATGSPLTTADPRRICRLMSPVRNLFKTGMIMDSREASVA